MKGNRVSIRWLSIVLAAGIAVALRGWVVAAPVEPGVGVPAHNGDVDGSGEIDVSDAICLLNYLFRGGSELPNGDVNGNGQIDLSDVICLVQWLFAGGGCPSLGEWVF